MPQKRSSIQRAYRDRLRFERGLKYVFVLMPIGKILTRQERDLLTGDFVISPSVPNTECSDSWSFMRNAYLELGSVKKSEDLNASAVKDFLDSLYPDFTGKYKDASSLNRAINKYRRSLLL